MPMWNCAIIPVLKPPTANNVVAQAYYVSNIIVMPLTKETIERKSYTKKVIQQTYSAFDDKKPGWQSDWQCGFKTWTVDQIKWAQKAAN